MISLLSTTNDLCDYYHAIASVRMIVDKHQKHNGFVGWPSPNPYFWRTSGSMYLMVSDTKYGKIVKRMCTPFGEVKLLGSGFQDELIDISENVLRNTDWTLVDATDKVKFYDYVEGKLYGPRNLQCKEELENDWPLKVYCIERIGEHRFQASGEIFKNICLEKGQYEKSRQCFFKLSHGNNSF